MTDTDNRSATLRYLMQLAGEMQKLAQNAGAPSLALLFDMAADEARVQLAELPKSAAVSRPALKRSIYSGAHGSAPRRSGKAAPAIAGGSASRPGLA